MTAREAATVGRRIGECRLILLLVIAFSIASCAAPDQAATPPRQRRPDWRPSVPGSVRVVVEYDADFGRAHPDAEDTIWRTFDLLNIEWQRYRREWFRIEELTCVDTGSELDAVYVLSRFLLTTAFVPDTIHVRIVGRQLEVYSDGRSATPIGGLAFRRSDVVVVSAPENTTDELLAYYLFHEIGHLWGAHDLPFRGGQTTFGDKSRYTFDVDAGNAEILEESAGPEPRETPELAPAIIARRIKTVTRAARDPAQCWKTIDLLLHEAVPSNPAWRAGSATLLAELTDPSLRQLIIDQEITPAEARAESSGRGRIASAYWRANAALEQGDTEAAELYLDLIRDVRPSNVNATEHTLLSAVERKIRKRR